jgi:hypothetical protein
LKATLRLLFGIPAVPLGNTGLAEDFPGISPVDYAG